MHTHQKVMWQEGMFLQPQHFQQQDRYLEYLISQHHHLSKAYGWGVTHLKINHDLLKLGKLGLMEGSGILPDSTLFNIPNHDDTPDPITIPAGIQNQMVYLALPLYRPGKNDRYNMSTVDIRNDVHDSELSTPIQIGKLNLRLMLENENRDIYSHIAITRILEIQADHQIILDEQFLAPCLNIHAIPILHNLIIEIHGLLHYRGNKLVERLHHNGSSGLAGITDFMLLQIINRAEPLFEHLIHQKNLHPEQLYQILLQLNGELSTLTDIARRPTKNLVYKHDKLQETFEAVSKKLRQALSIVLEETAVAIPLEERPNSTWVARIDDKTLFQKASFILAVHAQLAQEELKQSVLAQVKLAPTEEIRILVNRALPGIALQPLAVAPRQIPHHANYVYFSLTQQGFLWKQTTQSTGLAIHIGGLFPGLKLEFWAIRG